MSTKWAVRLIKTSWNNNTALIALSGSPTETKTKTQGSGTHIGALQWYKLPPCSRERHRATFHFNAILCNATWLCGLSCVCVKWWEQTPQEIFFFFFNKRFFLFVSFFSLHILRHHAQKISHTKRHYALPSNQKLYVLNILKICC